MYQPISSRTSSKVPLHNAWLNSNWRAPASNSTAGIAMSTRTSLLVKFDSGTQMPYQSSPFTLYDCGVPEGTELAFSSLRLGTFSSSSVARRSWSPSRTISLERSG